MRPPTATLVGVSVALGASVLGLMAFGASAMGVAGARLPAVLLLAVGGLLAATIRWRRRDTDADAEALAHLGIADTALEGGDPTVAHAAASRAFDAAATSSTRNRALTTLAWAALGEGYPERAKAALDRVDPPHQLDVRCLAAVEAARGRTKFAIQALELARASGGLTRDDAKLLVDCHLRAFGMEGAVAIAIQNRKALGRENCELVMNAARLAEAHAAAATLAAALRGDAGAHAPPLSGAVALDAAAARRG